VRRLKKRGENDKNIFGSHNFNYLLDTEYVSLAAFRIISEGTGKVCSGCGGGRYEASEY
jgi:hypothetical protein